MSDALELLRDLDEAIDASGGDTVLVSHALLERVHRSLVKMQSRKSWLDMADALGIPLDGPPALEISSVDYKLARQEVLQSWEWGYLKELVKLFPKNLGQAARHAGIDRKYLRELLSKHGLEIFHGNKGDSDDRTGRDGRGEAP